MKDIKSIAISIPSEDDDYIELDSKQSLSDCDIVVFNPCIKNTNYSTYSSDSYFNKKYQGKDLYNHESSTLIKEHCNHWKKEISSYLKNGKNLFVILSPLESFFIQTGRKEFSGTGKNRHLTNIIKEITNYDFLPKFDGIEIHEAQGSKMIVENVIFKSFLETFKNLLTYKTYLTSLFTFKVGITTKAKDKILAGIFKNGNGNVIFLPNIDFNSSGLIDGGEWSNEAISLGKRFKQIIFEIDSFVSKDTFQTPIPDWLSNSKYVITQSLNIQEKIDNVTKQIKILESDLIILKNEFDESERLKDLLFETGIRLEVAVTKALKLLGFHAENFDNGILELDQVIISPEGIRYIGECEGKDGKAIDISKFRQLADSLNEDFEREDVTEKAYGLLIGNPNRLQNPEERNNPFTEKCLKAASREKIGLIETKELYNVAINILNNNDEEFKAKCRQLIYDGLGGIIKFGIPN